MLEFPEEKDSILSPPVRGARVSIIALGTALSAALVALYVLCAIAELVFPNLPLAHGWLALFSTGPTGSAVAWIGGIVGSTVFGWITAVVFGVVYNAINRSSQQQGPD